MDARRRARVWRGEVARGRDDREGDRVDGRARVPGGVRASTRGPDAFNISAFARTSTPTGTFLVSTASLAIFSGHRERRVSMARSTSLSRVISGRELGRGNLRNVRSDQFGAVCHVFKSPAYDSGVPELGFAKSSFRAETSLPNRRSPAPSARTVWRVSPRRRPPRSPDGLRGASRRARETFVPFDASARRPIASPST